MALSCYLIVLNQYTSSAILMLLSPFVAYAVIAFNRIGKSRLAKVSEFIEEKESWYQQKLASESLRFASLFYAGTFD